MLSKLKTFSVLARCGSYTEAAKMLFCSQPAVTQHIKFLENYYQDKLVIRKNHQVVLTERGTILKKYADQLIGLFEEMDDRMSSAAVIQESVSLYMSQYIAENYFCELFDAEHSCCRKCPCEINGFCYKELREKLFEKKAKFAVMPIYRSDLQIQQSYTIQPLFEEELYLVLSAAHPLAQRKVIYAKDLKDMPVLLTQSVYLQELVKQALSGKEVPVFYMQMTDFKIIKKALEQNAAVSFMPKKVVSPKDSTLVCRSVKGMRIKRENGLVIDPTQLLTEAEEAYCRHITEQLSS